MHDIVIIPTYNENKNISSLIRELVAMYPDLHIYVVDDSSPDGTAKTVEQLSKRYSQIEILVRAKKNGLGEAYKDALTRLRKKDDVRYIFTMDADGSHDLKYISEMRKALQNSADLVIGSRYIPGGGVEDWEVWRKMLSYGGNMYSRFFSWLAIHDLTAGFVGFKSELLARMDLEQFNSSGYAYQIEFKWYCVTQLQAKVIEIPIIFKMRREGESKISHQIIHEGIITPLRLAWKRLRQLIA